MVIKVHGRRVQALGFTTRYKKNQTSFHDQPVPAAFPTSRPPSAVWPSSCSLSCRPRAKRPRMRGLYVAGRDVGAAAFLACALARMRARGASALPPDDAARTCGGQPSAQSSSTSSTWAARSGYCVQRVCVRTARWGKIRHASVISPYELRTAPVRTSNPALNENATL